MIRYLVLLAFSIFSSIVIVAAQKNKQQDYVVLLSGDTLRGSVIVSYA